MIFVFFILLNFLHVKYFRKFVYFAIYFLLSYHPDYFDLSYYIAFNFIF